MCFSIKRVRIIPGAKPADFFARAWQQAVPGEKDDKLAARRSWQMARRERGGHGKEGFLRLQTVIGTLVLQRFSTVCQLAGPRRLAWMIGFGGRWPQSAGALPAFLKHGIKHSKGRR